jgi:hypothetical protein
MVKIIQKKPLNKKAPCVLDKLAQLGTLSESKAESTSKSQKHYLTKARKKAVSYGIASKLTDVKDSPLHKAYVRTFFCNRWIEVDREGGVRTEYCKQRWCPICNGVRTAELINGYLPTLLQLGNLWFVTLTRQSVKANELRSTFQIMKKSLRHIQHNVLRKKHRITLQGIRKIESNYNANTDTFNPHMHLVLSAENINDVYALVQEWLYYNPDTTDSEAQNIRKVDLTQKQDKDFLLELFKYATKTVTKDGFSPDAQDVIYTALFRTRAIQPMGIKKIPKEKRTQQVVKVDFQPLGQVENYFYDYQYYDWIAANGTKFTGYKPDKKTKQILRKIENPISDFKRL